MRLFKMSRHSSKTQPTCRQDMKKDLEVFSIYCNILTTDILFYTGTNGEFGTFCITRTVYSVLLQEEGFNWTTFLQASHSRVSSCALCYLCKFYLHCLQVLNVFQLYHCLEEYRNGSHHLMAFERRSYFSIFMGTLAAITTMNEGESEAAAYHGEKSQMNHIHWHNVGMQVNQCLC